MLVQDRHSRSEPETTDIARSGRICCGRTADHRTIGGRRDAERHKRPVGDWIAIRIGESR